MMWGAKIACSALPTSIKRIGGKKMMAFLIRSAYRLTLKDAFFAVYAQHPAQPGHGGR